MRPLVKCLAFLVCCGLVLPAYGASCTIVSASTAFGNYLPVSNATIDKTAIGSIQVQCDSATTVTISLAVGVGIFQTRAISSGRNALNYNVYADAGHQQIWGDGTGGTVTVAYTFSGSGTHGIPVYGEIPKGQTAAVVGIYNATPQVIITWP